MTNPRSSCGDHCGPAVQADTRTIQSAASGASIVYRIDKMDCPTEEALLRKAVGGMPGVQRLDFNLIERTLRVTHALPDPAPISAAIATTGMQAVLHAPAGSKEPAAAAQPAISRRQWVLMSLSGVAAIGSEVTSYLLGNEMSPFVAVLAVTAILLGGIPTLKKGWIALKTLTLNINLLMSVAVIGAVLIGEWPEAAVVIWLFGLAEMIEAMSLDRARNAIRSLMVLTPEKASVAQPDGSFMEIGADAVPLDAIVRVKPGERVPLDGIVKTGRSSVNQAPITGESMPVEKQPGDRVFAGSINQRGAFELRVTAAKGETMLDRIARLVQEAQGQRAPTQRFVDQFARVYTPIVFVVALLVALVPPLAFGLPWYDWIYKALVLLVIACPCALVISTPVTIVSGLCAAARCGILIKGGLYLEQGRRLASVALDKTGTLTHGTPRLTDIVPVSDLASDDVLRIAASLDALSEHPIAAAIVDAYGKKSTGVVTHFEALPGRGVKGDLDGITYYLGNHRLIEELGVCSALLEDTLDKLEIEAKTAVVLADGKQALAVLAVADRMRDSSREAIASLKALGIAPVMLTGDNEKTAAAIAKQAGITEAHGNLLPEDKLTAIGELRKRGPVGMVGDGVNDAPALAKADIGFAMGAAGTDTAIETADVALMHDDLRKLPEFIDLSRRTSAILWQNIVLAISVKVVFFVLTFTGQTTLWMAVFADMGASLLVVFNGLRLLKSNSSPARPQQQAIKRGAYGQIPE